MQSASNDRLARCGRNFTHPSDEWVWIDRNHPFITLFPELVERPRQARGDALARLNDVVSVAYALMLSPDTSQSKLFGDYTLDPRYCGAVFESAVRGGLEVRRVTSREQYYEEALSKVIAPWRSRNCEILEHFCSCHDYQT